MNQVAGPTGYSPEGRKPFCRSLLRGFTPQWTFPMGRPSPRHGTSPPGRLKRDVVTSAPGKSAAGNRPQKWRQEGKSLTPRRGRGERRHRRDNGGATAPVAASRVFRHQTVAKPETAPAGSAEPGGCVSSCLAESKVSMRSWPTEQQTPHSKNSPHTMKAGRAAPQARPACISGRRQPARGFLRPDRSFPHRNGG